MNDTSTTPSAAVAMQTAPRNNPRTGRIDTGERGFTFAGEMFCKGQFAFAPRNGNTQWFPTYAAARAAFDAAHS